MPAAPGELPETVELFGNPLPDDFRAALYADVCRHIEERWPALPYESEEDRRRCQARDLLLRDITQPLYARPEDYLAALAAVKAAAEQDQEVRVHLVEAQEAALEQGRQRAEALIARKPRPGVAAEVNKLSPGAIRGQALE